VALSDNLPAPHTAKTTAPVALMNFPVSHARQLPWPDAGWNVPAAQIVHAVGPFELICEDDDPAGQLKHDV
jgi:hypothetical protein